MIPNPTQVSAAPIVAAALGRNIGVKVEFGHYSTAFTNGETIFLPRLPVELPKAVETILWGFIHHEAGHIRHSDFATLENPEVESDPFVARLLKQTEDVRMERAHIALYPGAGRILSELVSELVRAGFFSPVEEGDLPAAFLDFTLKHLRTTVLGQGALSDQSARSRTFLEQALGTGFVTRLSAVLTRGVLEAASSHDCLDLAIRLRQFLEDEIDAAEEPPQPGGDSSDPSDGQSAPPDDGASSPDAGDTGPSSSDSDGVPECADGPPDSSDEDTTADDGTAVTSSSGNDGSEVADALREILSCSVSDPSLGDLGEAVGQLLGDHVDDQDSPVFGLPKEERSSSGHRDHDAISEALRVSTRLAVQLRRRLESINLIPDAPKHRGKRVSRRHLSRVAFGDTRVFRSEVIGPEVNTAVALLVDASGSMGGDKIGLACRSALATALALETIPKLSCTVAAFPGRNGDDSIELMKGFSEDPKLVSSRFHIHERGVTPLTEALIWAGHCLSMRGEERRVVYVATDGEPNHLPSARQMIVGLQKAGIEVHGLGIDTDDASGLFDSFSRVTEVSRLPEAFIALSDRVLKHSA